MLSSGAVVLVGSSPSGARLTRGGSCAPPTQEVTIVPFRRSPSDGAFEPSNTELVRRCLEDDPAAWTHFVDRFARLVNGIAYRAGLLDDEAADVFQAVYLTAYRNLHLLDQPESLPGWLATIARREAWRVCRTGRTAGEPLESVENRPGTHLEASGPLPLADVERTERLFLVHQALDRLDARCRRLLQMLFFDDPPPSYDQAASALSVPLGSVGPIRARCLAKLRKALNAVGF